MIFSAFRILHSAFCIPHSALSIQHSAFSIPHGVFCHILYLHIMGKNLKALAFGLLIALLLCELILRLYNPFNNFTRKGKLILPANQQAVFDNKWIPQLDRTIFYSRNALGFRGPMPADSISQLNSIICIGGSTTECRFLSDSTTWPFLLGAALADSIPNVWVNNAGIDGHSTFGHLLLLQEYILKLQPKYVLFLTGINDVETGAPVSFDAMNENKLDISSVKRFLKSAANKTEIGSTAFQLYSIQLAYKKGLIHKEVSFGSLPDTILPAATIAQELNKQEPFLTGYQNRLQQLIQLCKNNGITPILLTQPSLYGNYTDPTTGLPMGNKYLLTATAIRNNSLQEQLLEQYNDVVRSFSKEVPVIDLAKLMPKNTAYYYDFIHFNNSGAALVSLKLKNEMINLLKSNSVSR
jgi:hypothetical protein